MTLAPLRDIPTPRAAPDSAARPAGSTPTPQARWSRDWATKGRCASQDPDTLFVQGKEQRLAKVLCKGCPVMAECLADALDNRTPFGVWGGMTERERRALLRARPDVENWTTVLQEMRRAGAGAW